ncbi:hypothetical protein PV08_06816 [Exophiala spinifera]|uniref:Methyltransferase type 11 domain-containing protein n=1 Tax=Exophiala spinifera TaxID=91928 RepID=A0A0D2B5V6_9EURO|nr:uncharacterized protein PV08_06816 [Exophiala spinifera]KIW14035.1 hypothetical protein PV08_06816 [Exophiala spinifera]
MSVLPSTTYQSPPRLARGRQLNTIIEEKEDGSQGVKSDSEGDGSDSTIIGRPAAWNPQLFTVAPRKSSLATTTYAASPVSSCEPSPASSASDGFPRNSVRSSSSDSEAGTVFSDDCPSLASDPTTFASESSRSSCSSTRSSRNRYPALIIPRDSWGTVDSSPIKEIAYGMSPATKIRLSPTTLSALSRSVPAANAPPSLGDSNSTASESPCVQGLSAPVTPDLRQLEVEQGSSWGVSPSAPAVHAQHLEIALDDGHSVIFSPAEAHSNHSFSNILSPTATAWTEMVVSFPQVPGATPQDISPLMPTLDELKTFEEVKPRSNGSDPGVRLPPDALQILQRLAGNGSAENLSTSSGSGSGSSKKPGRRQEMRELLDPHLINRPRSADGETPISDYSFTQLSIPSPGGFFSSLQSGSRHTWCLNKSRAPSIPNTATAETFYNRPWDNSSSSNEVETVLDVDDTNLTEGPPTARQALFDINTSPKGQKAKSRGSEDDDLYGPGDDVKPPQDPRKASFEYDEKYFDELKHNASRNLHLTGSWLAAQTGYLSAILDSDPNDNQDEKKGGEEEKAKPDLAARRTVMFSDNVNVDAAVAVAPSKKQLSSTEPDTKEAVFLNAFRYMLSNRKRRDAFIHASSRLEAIQAFRVALPEQHITNLLGQHILLEHKRPKYAGPFSQNPRATGIFEQTSEQIAFKTAEREQLALASIEPSSWQIDALRTMYGGRLLASAAACQRLKTKSTIPLDHPNCVGSKRIRILDIGGTSCASWAWHAALEWPNVKIYTVITKEQSQSQRPQGKPKPEAPKNHRTVSVPHLWQLPFRSGHFDVISARSLHVLLKHNPVPGVPEIDEWDLALRECQRVLKPGGFIDYMIMDSTIAHAGPRGDAMSVEFGFELHRRGYEREAARSWLRRVKKEGFTGVKRAWVFVPMGRKPPKEVEESVHGYIGGWHSWRQGAKPFVPAPRPISEVSTISKIVKQYMDVEAVQGPVGSTEDVADLTGLLGARMWEEWLVKVRAESGREQARWLEGVDEMIEEGKEYGSGWKLLIGWARKPMPEKGKKAERAEITVAVEDLEELSPTSEECTEMGMIPMVIQE